MKSIRKAERNQCPAAEVLSEAPGSRQVSTHQETVPRLSLLCASLENIYTFLTQGHTSSCYPDFQALHEDWKASN